MENDLEILQDIIQNEYSNNKDIQFGDIRIAKPKCDNNNDFYFYYSGQGKIEEVLYEADIVLDLIARKMHGKHIPNNTAYVDLANNIYEPIYKLYKEYIKEINYYV